MYENNKPEDTAAHNTESSPPMPFAGGGRGPDGKFLAGNRLGTGNPHAKRTSQLRAMLLSAVSDEDLHAIIQRLIQLAKDGDLHAIRELLDRLVGKPSSSDLQERLEALEAAISRSREDAA